MTDYIEKVQVELIKGDRNAGEIKDATGLTYPQIFSALKELCDSDKVTHYFVYVTELPTLTYRLKKIPFWQLCNSK